MMELSLLALSLTSPVWVMLSLFLMICFSLCTGVIWAADLSFLSSSFALSYLSLGEPLVVVSLLITIFMFWATPSMALKDSFTSVTMALLAISILVFRTSGTLSFYVGFEASLIPIFILIMAWGYQPERLMAGMSLLMYTITASLPFFSMMFFLSNYFDLSSFTPEFFNISSGSTSLPMMMITLSFGMGLLVKLPLFIFHLWLPKAHVEAPVAGSMILAAILLKLGGFGLFRFSGVLVNSSSVISFIFATALVGGAWISILCVRQVDMKVLIAYSSVAHMSFVAASMMTFTSLGLWAAFSMMIAHAFSSSGMFLGANILYLRSHSRLIFMNKSVLKVLPAYSLFWFILAVANMGGPPTFNLFSEIVNIVLLISWSNLSLILICVIAGLAVAYTLILYSVSQHGFSSKLLKEWLPLTLLELKNLLAHSAFTVLAILVLPFLM